MPWTCTPGSVSRSATSPGTWWVRQSISRGIAQQGRIVEATRDAKVRYRMGRFFPDGKSLLVGMTGGEMGPGAQRLVQLTPGLDVPRLVPIPSDHVLTKSFYLLSDMPGRWIGGKQYSNGWPFAFYSSTMYNHVAPPPFVTSSTRVAPASWSAC